MKGYFPFSIILFLHLAACQNFPPQEKQASINNSVEHKELKGDYVENKSAHQTPDDYTHVVVSETPYYEDGPQQGRPEDGVFSPGTKLKLIQKEGSYSIVESSEKIRAWVADSAIKKL